MLNPCLKLAVFSVIDISVTVSQYKLYYPGLMLISACRFHEVQLDSDEFCVKVKHKDGEVIAKTEGCDQAKDIICAMPCVETVGEIGIESRVSFPFGRRTTSNHGQ